MKNKESKIKNLISGFAFRMISGVILWFALLTVVVSSIGYVTFTDSLTKEYNDSAFRTAESAVMLVDGDKIAEYLASENGRNGSAENPFVGEEYAELWTRMNILCQKQNVTLIYVIKVDTSDYGRYESVFNVVNDASGYTPWEVGYKRTTTNDEYRKVYRDI